MRRVVGALAAIVLVLAVLGAFPGRASAAPAGQSAGSGTGTEFICSTTSSSASTNANGPFLPIDRWAGAAGPDLHTRLSGGFFGVNDLPQEANREIQSISLSLGNTLWQGGTDLVGLAGRFCFAGKVGVQIDHAAASLGRAISSSGILVAIVVAVIVVALWRARKGASPWRSVLRMAVMVGILTTMLAGASATRKGPGGTADFGTFSPGWLVNEVYGTVASLSSVPTEVITSQPTSLTGLAPQGPTSCGAYMASLVSLYRKSYGGTAQQLAASLPIALDDMWEQAGLRTYIEVQFGAANTYGLWAYCHLLDYDAGYSPAQQVQLLPKGISASPSALAWPAPGSSNATVDAAIIGWAACEGPPGHWAIPRAWISAGVTAQACNQWWTSSGVPSALDWGTGTSKIANAAATASSQGANGAALANFLLNFHGDANGTADAAAITYAASSVVVFGVFALLAGAVLVAKTTLLLMMLLLAVTALLSAWPGASSNRLGQVARYTLGLIVFSTGAQIVLALIALVTGVVSEMVGNLTGQGSFLDVLAMGFAPVGAVYILHFVFTKVLRAPSPFKLSGALAWASSAGSVGGGIAQAVDRNVDQRGLAFVRGAAASARTAVLARYGAPRPDRMGTMQPAGRQSGSSPNGSQSSASRPAPGAQPRPGSPQPAQVGPAPAGGTAGSGSPNGGRPTPSTGAPSPGRQQPSSPAGTRPAGSPNPQPSASRSAPGAQPRPSSPRPAQVGPTPAGATPNGNGSPAGSGAGNGTRRPVTPRGGREPGDDQGRMQPAGRPEVPTGTGVTGQALPGPTGDPRRDGADVTTTPGSTGTGAGRGPVVVGSGLANTEAPRLATAPSEREAPSTARAPAAQPAPDLPGAMPPGEGPPDRGDANGLDEERQLGTDEPQAEERTEEHTEAVGAGAEQGPRPNGPTREQGQPAPGRGHEGNERGGVGEAAAAVAPGATGVPGRTDPARTTTDRAGVPPARAPTSQAEDGSATRRSAPPGGARPRGAQQGPRPQGPRPGPSQGPGQQGGVPNRQARPSSGPTGTATRPGAMAPGGTRPGGDAGHGTGGGGPTSSGGQEGTAGQAGNGQAYEDQTSGPKQPGQQSRPGPGGTPTGASTATSWRRLTAQRLATERAERRAEREGFALLREAEGGRVGQARNAVNDRARLAWERARDKPVRTALRATVGAGVVVAGGAVAVASAPVAAGAGALYASHKAFRWRAEAPARQAERDRRRQAALAAYRASQANRPQPK